MIRIILFFTLNECINAFHHIAHQKRVCVCGYDMYIFVRSSKEKNIFRWRCKAHFQCTQIHRRRKNGTRKWFFWISAFIIFFVFVDVVVVHRSNKREKCKRRAHIIWVRIDVVAAAAATTTVVVRVPCVYVKYAYMYGWCRYYTYLCVICGILGSYIVCPNTYIKAFCMCAPYIYRLICV